MEDTASTESSAPERADEATAKPAAIKPRVWTVFTTIVLAMVAAIGLQAGATAGYLLWEMSQGTDLQQVVEELPDRLVSPWVFMLMAASSQLGFFLTPVLAARLSPASFPERLGLLRARPSWLIYPLTMLGSLVPTAIGFSLAEALAKVIPPDPTVVLLYEKMTLASALSFVVLIALAPGICEELLFRGYAQRRLLDRWGPGPAITITSLMFAAAHVMPHHVLFVIPLGIWLGVVGWRCGSILPCIACHAFINGSVNAWRVAVKFGEISEMVQSVFVWASGLVGLLCFLLALRMLFRKESGVGSQESGEKQGTP